MNETLDVMVAAGGAIWEPRALSTIESSADLHLVRRCVDVADLLASTRTHRAHCVLVDADLSGLDLDVVARLEARGLTVWSVASDARHLGITRTIEVTELDRLYEVNIPRREDTVVLGSELPARGTLIAVWGPTGAPGRTTVAMSLAGALADRGVRTALVDADTRGGSVAQQLAILDDVSGLMAACRDANLGKSRDVERHLLQVKPRLNVMTGLPRADMWSHIKPAALERVLVGLVAHHQVVIVDCGFGIEEDPPPGPSRDQATRTVLGRADTTVLVGGVGPVGLSRLLRAHEEAGPWETAPIIVLNGLRPSLGWEEDQIVTMVENVTGVRPEACLPWDSAAVDKATMTGQLVTEIAPHSDLARRLTSFAAMIRSTVLLDAGVVP